MDDFQYRRKKQEVLEKFPPEFRELKDKSTIANHIFNALVHDIDVYELLYELIGKTDQILAQHQRYVAFGPPPQYIVGTQEMIDKLKKDHDEG